MKIGTLGPKLTNSEQASYHYIKNNIKENTSNYIALYDTPELSIEGLINSEVDKAILCIVYPKLNDVVFKNLDKVKISEVFNQIPPA